MFAGERGEARGGGSAREEATDDQGGHPEDEPQEEDAQTDAQVRDRRSYSHNNHQQSYIQVERTTFFWLNGQNSTGTKEEFYKKKRQYSTGRKYGF